MQFLTTKLQVKKIVLIPQNILKGNVKEDDDYLLESIIQIIQSQKELASLNASLLLRLSLPIHTYHRMLKAIGEINLKTIDIGNIATESLVFESYEQFI